MGDSGEERERVGDSGEERERVGDGGEERRHLPINLLLEEKLYTGGERTPHLLVARHITLRALTGHGHCDWSITEGVCQNINTT